MPPSAWSGGRAGGATARRRGSSSDFDVVRCRADGSGTERVATCDASAGDVCFAGACENACPIHDRKAVYVKSVGESRSEENQILLERRAT